MLLKASTMASALLNTPQSTQGCAESVINPGLRREMLSLSRCLWVPRLGHHGTRLISTGNSLGSSVVHDATKDIAPNPNQWAPTVSAPKGPDCTCSYMPAFRQVARPRSAPNRKNERIKR